MLRAKSTTTHGSSHTSIATAVLVFAMSVLSLGLARAQVTPNNCDGGDLGDDCSLRELRDRIGFFEVESARPSRMYTLHSWRVSDENPITLLGDPAAVRVSVDATHIDRPVITLEAEPTVLRNDNDLFLLNETLLGRFAFDRLEAPAIHAIQISLASSLSVGDASPVCDDLPEGGLDVFASTAIRPSESSNAVANAVARATGPAMATSAVDPVLPRGNVDFSMTASFCDDPETVFRGYAEVNRVDITLVLQPFGDANCDGDLSAGDLTELVQLIANDRRSDCQLDDVSGDGGLDERDLSEFATALFSREG